MLDSFGRKIDYMRFSITDRCDLRCRYCMPKNMVFSDKKDLLNLEDLKNLSQSLVEIGIKKIRITQNGDYNLLQNTFCNFFSILGKSRL